MKVHIKNLGPVREADIETQPLTIIIGRNNQGKSYCAELIFSLLQLQRFLRYSGCSYGQEKDGTLTFSLMPSHFGRGFTGAPYDAKLTTWLGHVRYPTIKLSPSDLQLPTEELADKLIDRTIPALAYIMKGYFPLLLEERFGMKPEELISIGTSSAAVTVDFSEYLQFLFTISTKGETEVVPTYIGQALPEMKQSLIPDVEKMKKQWVSAVNAKIPQDRQPPPLFFFETIQKLTEKLLGISKKERIPVEPEIFYIPAGRAGLLEGFYSVASAYFYLATVALPRAISMPAMPPTASVFYNLLMEFTAKPGQMSSIATELAKEVLGGEIILEPDSKQPALKKIIYRPFIKDQEPLNIDIIHAGSMVKELACLYLVIREKVTPNTQLIIEEPEAHLHPSAQRKLAKLLMKLASRGVDVRITTHSDIILREIAHLVGKYGNNKSHDVLPSTKVAVVFLKESEKGSVSEKLIIPPTGVLEGLPTFDEVIMQLYEEEVNLESSSTKE